MSDVMKNFGIAVVESIITGVTIAVFIILFLWLAAYMGWPQTREEMQRDYDAYRECIPKPNCMTATDYIDYYDLKWKLEKR